MAQQHEITIKLTEGEYKALRLVAAFDEKEEVEEAHWLLVEITRSSLQRVFGTYECEHDKKRWQANIGSDF